MHESLSGAGMEDWFVQEPRDKKNEESSSDLVWKMRADSEDTCFRNLVTAGTVDWVDFYAFLKEQEMPVFLDADCCVTAGKEADPPEEFGYHLDVIVKSVDSKTYKVQLSAPEASCAASTLSYWLSWLQQRSSLCKDVDVTVKAFATQPRALLPVLQLILSQDDGVVVDDDEPAAAVFHNNNFRCLRFHFLTIEQPIHLRGIPHVEFVQCTVNAAWSELLSTMTMTTEPNISNNSVTLTVSCTMPEFAKLAPALNNNTSNIRDNNNIATGIASSSSSSVTELNLLLHFCVQGAPLDSFCQSLHENTVLEKLTLQYLDVSDEGWMLLLQSLRHHPSLQSLSIAFTDNFVDANRRLTPERRTKRTQAVLDLVRGGSASSCSGNNNTNVSSLLREVTWPACQKDDALVPAIEAALEENRVNNNNSN